MEPEDVKKFKEQLHDLSINVLEYREYFGPYAGTGYANEELLRYREESMVAFIDTFRNLCTTLSDILETIEYKTIIDELADKAFRKDSQ